MTSNQESYSPNPDTVSVFIGLGELGVRCLRCLKEKCKSASSSASGPRRFFGVDRDDRGNQGDSLPTLSEQEFLNIGADAQTLAAIFQGPDMSSEAFAWFRADCLPATDDVSGDASATDDASGDASATDNASGDASATDDASGGASVTDNASGGASATDDASGGVRQIGRLLMMRKDADFRGKLRKMMSDARNSVARPRFRFYVFAGLGGAVGSGTFLDVCFLLRDVARQEKEDVTLFGCFFPSFDPKDETKARNSRASMRELDYCMNFSWNGGAFRQKRPAGEISWNGPPLDFCFLLVPPPESHSPLEWLTDTAAALTSRVLIPGGVSDSSAPESVSDLRSVDRSLAALKKRAGNPRANYFTVGIVRQPLYWNDSHKWMTAWLSQKLNQLSGPDVTQAEEEELKNLVLAALGNGVRSPKDLVSKLVKEIRESAEADFTSCGEAFWHTWQNVRESGFDAVRKQFQRKSEEIKKRYQEQADDIERRAMERICARLDDMSVEFRKGPFLVSRLLDKGWKEKNKNDVIFAQLGRLLQCVERARSERRAALEKLPGQRRENAWDNFNRKTEAPFRKKTKAMRKLLREFETAERDDLVIDACERLERSLYQLWRRLLKKRDEDYEPFKRAVEGMLQSLREQFDGKSLSDIEAELPEPQLLEILKKRVSESTDMDSFLNDFMRKLREDFENWKRESRANEPEDMEKLMEILRDDAPDANEFLWKSLDEYFRERCEEERPDAHASEERVAQYVYDTYFRPPLKKLPSRFPLADTDAEKYMLRVFLPERSMTLRFAADLCASSPPFSENDASSGSFALTDDAPLLTYQCHNSDEIIEFFGVRAFPAYACPACADCEKLADDDDPAGLYLYEGGAERVPDWRALPSIVPLDEERRMGIALPETERKRREEMEELYEQARRIGILSPDGSIYAPGLSGEDWDGLSPNMREFFSRNLDNLKTFIYCTRKTDWRFPLGADASEMKLKALFFSAPDLRENIRRIAAEESQMRESAEKRIALWKTGQSVPEESATPL